MSRYVSLNLNPVSDSLIGRIFHWIWNQFHHETESYLVNRISGEARSKSDLVKVLCISAIEQWLEDNDGFVEVPHEHSVYCVDHWHRLWTVHITLCPHRCILPTCTSNARIKVTGATNTLISEPVSAGPSPPPVPFWNKTLGDQLNGFSYETDVIRVIKCYRQSTKWNTNINPKL